MFDIFFHPLKWDSDVYIMYAIWVMLIPFTLYVIRFIYKCCRSKIMKYQKQKIYLVRDLFLILTGIEYLVFAVIIYSIYMGFWAFYVGPNNADWLSLDTYLIILPQIALLIVIIVLFSYRYIKFRKSFIK